MEKIMTPQYQSVAELESQSIQITNITNPFDPLHNREFRTVPRGTSLRECIDLVRNPLDGCFYVAAVNGELVPEGTDYSLVYPQGSVVLCAVPEGGGGGGGKNILRTILSIVVVVVAAAATWYVGGAGGWGTAAAMFGSYGVTAGSATAMAIGAAVGAMVSMAGNMLINALIPYSAEDMTGAGGGGTRNSPTYSWEALPNANREGVVWPVLYGTMRIVPPIISKYIEVVGDKQYLNILYAIADHEIDEIDETSIKINDNIVAKGENGISWEIRLGADDQSVIQYFNDTRTTKTVGSIIGTSWTTVDADGAATEGLGVAISFPRGLYTVADDGSIGAASVSLDIEYKKTDYLTWEPLKTYNTSPESVTVDRWSAGYWSGSSWIEYTAGSTNPADHKDGDPYAGNWAVYSGDDVSYTRMAWQWRWVENATLVVGAGAMLLDYVTITGSQTDPLRRVFYADRLPAGEYQVRIRHHNGVAPPNSTRIANTAYIDYTESIIYDDFTYPGSALFALRALATDKLSGGMPSVSLVATRSTVPVWTGAAYEDKAADNPAWASYDALHNSDYGGGVPVGRMAYADFLAWANNCDTHNTSPGVPSPTSFRCNLYIDSAANLRKILNTIGQTGRGSVVQLGSNFTCFVDKIETVPAQSFIFNVGNIAAKSFSLEYLDMDSRANAVDVTYWDKDDDYKQKTLEIHAADFDETTVEVKKSQLSLAGCTSRAEALCHGYYAMNCNRYLTCTASFTADIDAIGCLPWDVVEVQHDVTLWGDGGRTVSATSDTITIDKVLTLAVGTTYTLRVQDAATDAIHEYTLAAVETETETDELTITGSFDPVPALYDKWVVTAAGSATKLFRMIKTSRQGDLTRKLICLEYNPSVYDDTGTLQAPETVLTPTYVAHLKAIESAKWNGSPETEIFLSWTGFAPVWRVFWRRSADNDYICAGETNLPFYRLSGLDPGAGLYTFCVSHTRNPEDGETITLEVTGAGAVSAPATPANFTAAVIGRSIVLSWDAPTDVTVTGHSIYLNGSVIAANVAGTNYVYSNILTAGVYNFSLKAVTRGGESDTAATSGLTVSLPGTPAPAAVTVGEQAVVTWADCKTTLPIDYYKVNTIRQGAALRYTERVNWTGGKDYAVIAVDIAGNESAAGSVTLTVTALTAATQIAATGLTYAIRLDLTYDTFTGFSAVEIWSSTSNNRATALKVGETAGTSFTHTGLTLTDTRYYWTKIRDDYGNYGAWYPVSATAGVSGSTSTNPADYLTILTGAITEDELYTTLNDRIDLLDTSAFVLDETILEDNILDGLNGAFTGLSDVQAVHLGYIQGLQSSATAAAANILALQSEIAGLTTTEWSDTGSYIVGRYVTYSGGVYRCIQSYSYPTVKTPGIDTAFWEDANTISTLVAEVEARVDDLEGEIVLKASQTDFNALENTVTGHTSSISQNADDIALRVETSTFSAFSELFIPSFSTSETYIVNDYIRYSGATYRCILAIDFTPAPLPTNATYWEAVNFYDQFTTSVNQIDINTNGISLTSGAIIGPVTLLANIVENGIVIENIEDVANIDTRITQAGMDIDGAEASISLHASQISGLDSRLSQAEIDIDGAEAAIALKASQTSLDAAIADISAAGILIDGHTASIALQAIDIETLEATTGTHTTQINQAQIDIDAAETAITTKVSTATYNADQKVGGVLRIATAEEAIGALQTADGTLQSNINNKVAITTYEADQKVNGVLRVATAEEALEDLQTAYDNDQKVNGVLRITTAEQAIGALQSADGTLQSNINQKVSIATYDSEQKVAGVLKITTAQQNITALQAADQTLQTNINQKVSIASYDSDQKVNGVLKITTAEQAITALQAADGTLQSNINLKVSTATYTADQKVNGVLRITTAESRLTAIDNPSTGTVALLTNRMTAIDQTGTGRMAVAETTLSAAVSDVTGVKAQYTVKLNVNNRVAGFGLMLSGDTPSEFVIVAEKFKVIDNSDALDPKQVFTIGTVNGVSGVGINGDLIVDGSILARNIGSNEVIANTANIKDAIITNAKITNATITGAKIASATITNANINDLSADKINAGTLAAARIAAGSITADKLSFSNLAGLNSSEGAKLTGIAAGADVTLSAVNGGLTVTGGGITLSGGGAIKGGQTAYHTGTGFFLGYSGSAYKFSVGNPADKYMTFDGTTLTVSRLAVTEPAAIASGTLLDALNWFGPTDPPRTIWINTGITDGAWPNASTNSYVGRAQLGHCVRAGYDTYAYLAFDVKTHYVGGVYSGGVPSVSWHGMSVVWGQIVLEITVTHIGGDTIMGESELSWTLNKV